MSASDQFLRFIDAKRWWLFAIAVLLHAASFNGLWHIVPDSAVFLSISRNIAEGHGFVSNEETVANVSPGFPYLLAAIRNTGGDVFFRSVLFVHICGLISLALIFLLIRRHSGRSLAVLVTFLTAISAVFLRHCLEILSDIPFMAGCMLLLLGYEMTFPRVGTPDNAPAMQTSSRGELFLGSLCIAIGLAAMASLRLVFLAPLVALLVDLAWRTRKSRAKWLLLGGAAAAVAVVLAIRLTDPRMADGFKLLQKEQEIIQRLTDLPTTASRIWHANLPELTFNVTPRAIFGNKAGFAPIDLVLTLIIAIAGIALVRRRVLWGVLVAICFVQWSLFFADTRYFLPVLPLLILAWWDLAVWLSTRVHPRWAKAALIVPMLLLAAPNFARSVGFAIEQHRSPFLRHYIRGRYEQFPELGAAAAKQLPANAVILAGEQLAEPLHYFSRLRTISAYQQNLLRTVPEDRPVYVLVPADENFAIALKALNLTQGEPAISLNRTTDARPLIIAPVVRAKPN